MSKWTERDKKRAERNERERVAEEAEAKRRREDPSSKERMLDKLDEIIADGNSVRAAYHINTLANILRCHISGEEYFE